MTYSNTAIVALLVHCIVNYSVLRNRHFRNDKPAGKAYRWLMLSVAAFYVFDALWGVLYDAQFLTAVFVDTMLYFAAMTSTVFLWSRYVIYYVQDTSWLIKVLKHAGVLYLVFVAAVLIVNCFVPVMFWFDESGAYHAAELRYAILVMQVILFLVSACYVLFTAKGESKSVRRHHWAIGAYGIAMTTAVILQVVYPLLPLYSIGCLLGTCILHTFVLEDLKEDRRRELEEMLQREEEHIKELGSAKQMAYRDSLTGVKSKHAYTQWEETMDQRIKKGEQEPFAVVVCDINDLKKVNDLYGHHEGDTCIRNACARICGVFSHSPVFRIGGDEFAVVLSGRDYVHRNGLMEQINTIPKEPSMIRVGETISAGMACYDGNRHASFASVFEEADKAMYQRKQFLKETVLQQDNGTDDVPVSEDTPLIHAQKHILIADDIESNREILGDLLQDDYDILYASDGEEALELMRSHKGEIDLVLLDLQMPNKNGREVIAEMHIDDELMSIPVVFLTVDQDAELDCLKSGAMDFIPKPYPDIEIVKARIDKCIELSEDRDLIRHTERDGLTGLFNKDYFYRYVARLDHLYKDVVLDAVVCDVNRFHAANMQYGRKLCDRALRCIGAGIKRLARETGGIACRQEGDTFLLYCPHQYEYESLLKGLSAEVFADEELAGKFDLRFGVFIDAQREADIEERFARAKIAADRVRDASQTTCGFYDLG